MHSIRQRRFSSLHSCTVNQKQLFHSLAINKPRMTSKPNLVLRLHRGDKVAQLLHGPALLVPAQVRWEVTMFVRHRCGARCIWWYCSAEQYHGWYYSHHFSALKKTQQLFRTVAWDWNILIKKPLFFSCAATLYPTPFLFCFFFLSVQTKPFSTKPN